MKEDYVLDMANRLPHIFPEIAIDSLRTEVRMYNLQPKADFPVCDNGQINIAAAWHQVRQTVSNYTGDQMFPVLSKLSIACSTLFHGNADVERNFGKLHDIRQNEKRNRLSGKMILVTHVVSY